MAHAPLNRQASPGLTFKPTYITSCPDSVFADRLHQHNDILQNTILKGDFIAVEVKV